MRDWTEKQILIAFPIIVTLFTISIVISGIVNGETKLNITELDKMALSTGQRHQELESIIDYCFIHADSPNPVQDLVDKGFLPEKYNGLDCKTVKSMYDNSVEEFRKNLVGNLTK